METNPGSLRARLLAGWYWEGFCAALYLLFTSTQLFVPPIVGIADNGDFPKTLAPYSICAPNRERDAFVYVYPRYEIDYRCHWEPHLPSSELLVGRLLKRIALWTGHTGFRITGAGKIHLSIMFLALGILLWALHDAEPVLRFGLPPLLILIFSDVAYVSYLNSFYMDTAAMIFLLLTVSLAGAWVLRPRTWIPFAYAVAGFLMAVSKTQHILTAFLLAVVAAVFGARMFRACGTRSRAGWYWTAAAAIVTFATLLTVALTPGDYRAEPFYSLIFYRMAPDISDRSETLTALALPQSAAVYFGTHAYSEGGPMANHQWRRQFNQQLTYTRLASFYIHHPRIVASLLKRGLHEDLPWVRAQFLGNYQREDGFPPTTLARHFAAWSDWRTALLRIWPDHIVVFYSLIGLGALFCLLRRDIAERLPLASLALAMAVAGALEFLLAVLLDGTETSRHLFLFQVVTEILIVCTASGLLSLFASRRAVPKLDG